MKLATLTSSHAWKALVHHQQIIEQNSIRELFEKDPDRHQRFSLEAAGLFLDYSKNRITTETMGLLLALAHQQKVGEWRDRLFAGEPVNTSENKPVLHTALRLPKGTSLTVKGENIVPPIHAVLDRMSDFVTKVRDGTWKGATGQRIRDIVHIGIGGSDLGPALVTEALKFYSNPNLTIHFVSNVDGANISTIFKKIDPATTAWVIASKSFTTPETLTNAQTARQWFLDKRNGDSEMVKKHFVAATVNKKAAVEFGIDPANVFEYWDWVGGRFSVWSSVGLSIALSVGMKRFEEFLAGAHAMDEHFRNMPLESNIPVILALLGIWSINFWHVQSHVILPYDHTLRQLPAYLQQIDMESNGKSVDREGHPVGYATGPVVFGDVGTNSQHSFGQLLHQGPLPVPVDFIVPLQTHTPIGRHHQMLLANALGQAEALMQGRTLDEAMTDLLASGASRKTAEVLAPHKTFPGNRPSNTILFRQVDPFTLGALMALYEHKVFVQGIIWNIDSFDQWGVELGKQLTKPILHELLGEKVLISHDGSTAALLKRVRQAFAQ